MQRTAIEWADWTSNPVRAVDRATGRRGWWCSRVSPGCERCYAARLNRRLGNGLDYAAQLAGRVEWFLDEAELARWRRAAPGEVLFACDMIDLFHEAIPTAYVDRVLDAAAEHADRGVHVVLLTKRPETAARYASEWYARHGRLHPGWWGVSVEDVRRARERLPYLPELPVAHRLVSAEPLLEDISAELWECVAVGWAHWVIVGGESGPGARPLSLDWVRRIRDDCERAGAMFFYKQRGGLRPGGDRLLDGRTWDERPGRETA